MTLNWQDLDMLVRIETIRLFDMMYPDHKVDSTEYKEWHIFGSQSYELLWDVLELKLPEINSMQNGGTQSWIVISKGKNK